MKSKSWTAATTGTCRRALPSAASTASSRPVLVLRLPQPVGIAPLVAEFQRIDGRPRAGRSSRMSPPSKMALSRDCGVIAHVIAGAGNDELVGLEVAVEHHLAGLGALDPHVLRHLALAPRKLRIFGRTKFLIQFIGSSPPGTRPPAAILRQARAHGASVRELQRSPAPSAVARPSRSRTVADRADQRRADHDAVGIARPMAARLLRRLDAETDATGSVVCRLMRVTALRHAWRSSGVLVPVMPSIET